MHLFCSYPTAFHRKSSRRIHPQRHRRQSLQDRPPRLRIFLLIEAHERPCKSFALLIAQAHGGRERADGPFIITPLDKFSEHPTSELSIVRQPKECRNHHAIFFPLPVVA